MLTSAVSQWFPAVLGWGISQASPACSFRPVGRGAFSVIRAWSSLDHRCAHWVPTVKVLIFGSWDNDVPGRDFARFDLEIP